MARGLSDFCIVTDSQDFTYVVDMRKKSKVNLPTGEVEVAQLAELGPGGSFTVNEREYYVLDADGYTYVMKGLHRRTQIAYPKDASYALFRLDIIPGKRVGEAGTGSGAFTTMLSRSVGNEGHVYSYESSREFIKEARENLERATPFDNVTFREQAVEDGLRERELDAFFLDVKAPWDGIPAVKQALRDGGHLGVLVPTGNQVSGTIRSLDDHGFLTTEVLEIMLREFRINPARLRPRDKMVAHTGYLIFSRALKSDAETRA
jgi:tRNA (adenine57-N1/adenine58-N1)-methyltransferase